MERNSIGDDGAAEEASGAGGARRRDSLLLLGIVRRPGIAGEIMVKVRNLSPGGLMAEAPVPFVRGEPVQVELRGLGQVDGIVAWIAAGRIGISFDTLVDPLAARRPQAR